MAQNKKTVAELKNELYIATLIEEHQNTDQWLTTLVKESFDGAVQNVKLSHDENLLSHDDYFWCYLKEKDLLIYLLLELIRSRANSAFLSKDELECCQSMIIGHMDFDPLQVSAEYVSKRVFDSLSKPNISNDKVREIIAEKCNNGVHCFEPFSNLLLHSEKLTSSLEAAVIFKSIYAFCDHDDEIKKIDVHFQFGWNMSNYPGMTVDEADARHEKDVRNAAEAFIQTEKTHVVNTNNEIPDIFGHTNDEKYDSILISFAYNSKLSLFPLFQSDSILERLNENGYLIILFDHDYVKTIGSCSKEIQENWIEFTNTLVRSSELDAFIPDTGSRNMDIYILKKGKTNKNVSVFYEIASVKQDDYASGMLLYRDITQNDLLALDFDLKKVNMLPMIHASKEESFHPLSDLLEASNDKYIPREKTDFGKVFTPDNYATSFDTFAVHPSSLREAQVDDKWKKVSQPVFVMRRNPFAVAYVEATEEHPVFFRENTMTFSVKTDVVDLKYLYLLSINGRLEQLVKDCPNFYFEFDYTLYTDEKGGIHEGYWPAKSLLCYKGLIAIPSLAKQKELCEIAEKAEQAKVSKAALAQYRQDIHERKHALGQIMTQMRSNWESLLLAKNEHDGTLDDGFIYGKKHPHTIKQIFETLDSYMKELDEGIESFTPEDNAIFQTKEKIYLQEYLQEYVKTHSNPCFELQIDNSDEGRTYGAIIFSKKALETILQNLIFNAWKHGFKGRSSGNIILFSILEDEESIQLLVSNNGAPLDKNMDNGVLFKFGKSSSRGQESIDGHHHIGLGCHQVWCLMRDKGQGDVLCISEPEKEFPVTFKLVFNK